MKRKRKPRFVVRFKWKGRWTPSALTFCSMKEVNEYILREGDHIWDNHKKLVVKGEPHK